MVQANQIMKAVVTREKSEKSSRKLTGEDSFFYLLLITKQSKLRHFETLIAFLYRGTPSQGSDQQDNKSFFVLSLQKLESRTSK